MSQRRLVDTNLIVRFLVQDHEKHARAATKLFEASDRGEVILVILPVVLAESVFVLESFYKLARPEIARVLKVLVSSRGVEVVEKDIQLDALGRYGASKLHFVDCTIAAYASVKKWSVATFDSGLRKFADVKVDVD
jgi:predicted nucleic-acid-binding protein